MEAGSAYRRAAVEVSKQRPYSGLAPYYRQLMAHVDYAHWGAYLLKVLRQQDLRPRRLLELGAGNAMLSRYFIPPGLELRVTSDLSFEMMVDASRVTVWSRKWTPKTARSLRPSRTSS